ncbi:hydroxymethylbilane synthase [Mycetocola tolaasinivorans]|uniref:Porphobilinogen deaminase n=1 Tax=Mycetocola tolaasinivorans TaxID=76635 RepID=A0A3L7A8Y7_9MICO|nr:hydroxymethylbilane synthase [Mycetocola tolaasinivorans]RLP76799.1 hydroxymethylbilane synthase [Mycetocola tolaasinivorans]
MTLSPAETPGAVLRIGTRGSALALAQTGDVARAITEATGIETVLIPVTTHGDVTRASLASLGGTGVFASALRDFLLAGECDLVVHSMKDLPTAAAPGLAIGAVPVRADARDALCARDGLTLAELPEGARVGTGSPRRIAQLRRRRPDLEIVDIRGNIDTRLGFVTSGEMDAVVLAVAGLERLGREAAITERFELDAWPPAPAQGALAIEVRAADLAAAESTPIRAALAALEHAATRAEADAERAVLARLEAGCAAPIGAHAVLTEATLALHAAVYAPTGAELREQTRSARVSAGAAADAARGLGIELADALLADGAATIAPLN